MSFDQINIAQARAAATHLMGNERVMDGIAIQDCMNELERLRKLIAKKKLLCPVCKEPLAPVSFKGYYDSFECWMCPKGCEVPGAKEMKGGYA